jgi:hypothetical protein
VHPPKGNVSVVGNWLIVVIAMVIATLGIVIPLKKLSRSGG